MTPTTVSLIEAEYRRYKALAEGAVEQLQPAELETRSPATNSVATIMWHIAGNLASRFTDFLTSDGEKSWRDRESEFEERTASGPELLDKWEQGWSVLFGALHDLQDADLIRTVTIRGVELRVDEALFRSLAHTSYHVGQIVHVGKALRGDAWRYLSIPPGESADYNANPTAEKAASYVQNSGSP
jgi:uncharacterized damage-inducible protein DinB